MGNKVSTYFPTVARAAKNYNVENRAHRIVDKDKLPPAPRHPSTAKLLEDFAQEHPELYEQQKLKNVELHERLKSVYVESEGENPEVTAKPLPQSRKILEDTEFGFEEPEVIPEGKVTLRQTLEFIVKHQDDPQQNTVEQIASDYKLPISQVEEILKHFQTFQMHLSSDFVKSDVGKKIIKKEASNTKPTVYRLTSDSDKKSSESDKKTSETDNKKFVKKKDWLS